jgi:Holliday junction resolvasome RuvABC ATP-dependent DNA helicase subunit
VTPFHRHVTTTIHHPPHPELEAMDNTTHNTSPPNLGAPASDPSTNDIQALNDALAVAHATQALADDSTDDAAAAVITAGMSDSRDPFSRIIGQKRSVAFMKEIRDGLNLGATPQPLLLLGRSGHGKTSLARAFADSVGAEFVRIECGPELRSEQLAERLSVLKTTAVVFMDEVQGLRKRVQEVLYSAIDSNLVPRVVRGRLDRCADLVPVVPFILIAATNEPGRLLSALRSRMVRVFLDDYTSDDLRSIVRQKAARFLMRLTDEAVEVVVRASGGSPRAIVQVLQAIDVTSVTWRFNTEMYGLGTDVAGHDLSISDVVGEDLRTLVSSHGERATRGSGTDLSADPTRRPPGSVDLVTPLIPNSLVERALSWMGLDMAGLDATGRTLLSAISERKRATAELLATILGLDIVFAREQLAELRARRFVTAAPGQGWMLTPQGENVVKELSL